MTYETPKEKKRLTARQRSLISTLIGAGVAIANAWVNVEWNTFSLDPKHLMPLVVSGLIAIGGYMTSLNSKD